MPFDPAQPANGSPLDSQVMRDQLNGLKDIIDTTLPGPQGVPGEVTQAQLDAAVFGCAANPLSIYPLSMVVSNPPTQVEVQAIAQRLDELIGAIRKV